MIIVLNVVLKYKYYKHSHFYALGALFTNLLKVKVGISK